MYHTTIVNTIFEGSPFRTKHPGIEQERPPLTTPCKEAVTVFGVRCVHVSVFKGYFFSFDTNVDLMPFLYTNDLKENE